MIARLRQFRASWGNLRVILTAQVRTGNLEKCVAHRYWKFATGGRGQDTLVVYRWW